MILSVRTKQGYDYYRAQRAPRPVKTPSPGLGMSALRDALPLLPPDAVYMGSGRRATGVLCQRAEGEGLGDIVLPYSWVLPTIAIGIGLWWFSQIEEP